TDFWVVDRADALVYHYAGATIRRDGSQLATDTFALADADHHPEGIADPPGGVQVGPGLILSEFASVQHPMELAFAPRGSRYGPDLCVASGDGDYGANPSIPDRIVTVSATGVVRLFSTLLDEADPADLDFSTAGSPFGDFLYVSANNRDNGRPGDWGGTIQRIDPQGVWSDFTSLDSKEYPGETAMGEPGGIAFGPGGSFGTDLYVANANNHPADIVRVDSTGVVRHFVDDGVFGGGLAPASLAFGPGGAFSTDLYFADSATGSMTIRIAS